MNTKTYQDGWLAYTETQTYECAVKSMVENGMQQPFIRNILQGAFDAGFNTDVLIKKIKEVILRHEKSQHHYYAGDEADEIQAIISSYESTAANAIDSNRQMTEDTLVYFRSVVMITESIGMAGTHAEKAARLRGLIELLNSAITKLKNKQSDEILNNWRWMSWDYSTYPYQSILSKMEELKRENEQLKLQMAGPISKQEPKEQLPF